MSESERDEALRLWRRARALHAFRTPQNDDQMPHTLRLSVEQLVEFMHLARQSARCPHLRSSSEGTQYCALAQSAAQAALDKYEPCLSVGRCRWSEQSAPQMPEEAYAFAHAQQMAITSEWAHGWNTCRERLADMYATAQVPPAQPDDVRDALRQRNNMAEALKAESDRLDWLTRHISGKALREIGVVWPAWSEEASRSAIDAALQQSAERGEQR